MEYAIIRSDDYLEHHGVKGQKWGIRNYQLEDGSLTEEGRRRYGVQQGWEARKMYKAGTITKAEKKQATKAGNIIGKLDNISSLGFGRRIREFEDRHKKGLKAFNVAASAIGGMAVTALTAASGAAAPAVVVKGLTAVAGVIGTAIGSKIRYDVINPAMLKYGYNSKFSSNGFEPSYKRKS